MANIRRLKVFFFKSTSLVGVKWKYIPCTRKTDFTQPCRPPCVVWIIHNINCVLTSSRQILLQIIPQSFFQLTLTNLSYNWKTMSFRNRCDYVFFCRVDFHGPSVGKITFLIGQFSLPISRIVPTSAKLRSSPRPPVTTWNCY